MMKAILIPLLSVYILFSCQSSNQEDNQQEIVIKESHVNATLELNNGEKWEVNEEMKPLILRSADILSTYQSNNAMNHQELAIQLKEQNTALIKNCSMQGQAHDALHKWLLPHMNLIERLHKAENDENASEIIEELQISFTTFNTYFQ